MLFLNNNQLEGEVPREIENCNLIEEFFIFHNRLSGTLPDIFDSLYSMSWFSAYNNAFSGQIPDSIWDMPSLQYLQLHNNNLTGTVPDSYCLDLIEYNLNFSESKTLAVDNLKWFSDSPKVECSCCEQSCHLWDPVKDRTVGPVDCPEENIIDLWKEYGINPSEVEDYQLKESFSPDEGFCISPTGCYIVSGTNLTNNDAQSWYFGYSKSSQSVIKSENEICDAIDICGKNVGSYHPIRTIINYLTQVGLFDVELIYDPTSYQQKALCSILDTHYDFKFFDDLSDCDGTMLQFFAVHLFLNSLNYFDDSNFVLTTNEMCDITGAYCDDDTNKYVEKIDLHDKNLYGHFSSEIRFLERLKKIDLSGNKISGIIDESIFNDTLPNLEIINMGHNSLKGDTEVIRAMLARPLLKEFNISNNLFTGTLPSLSSNVTMLGK